MSYLDWHVGMKVVKVSAPQAHWRVNAKADHVGELLPKNDSVYTLRSIMAFGDDVWVHIVEVVNIPRLYKFPDGVSRFIECPFEARYFRPVQTRKTDISVFTAMLTKTTVWA